jgi:hypothetical protein
MIRNVKHEKIKELLLKAAKGYQVAEVTVEYAEVNGKMQVTKRKETKKEVPGDLKALQMLLESEKLNADEFSRLSDEELEQEKRRLLKKLEQGDEHGKIGSGCQGDGGK